MPIVPLVTPLIATIMVCVSLVVIFIFAPVPHVNVPMSENKRRKMRKIARTLGSGFAGISLALLWILPHHFGIVMSVSLGVIAFSMLCAWIKRMLRKPAC